MSDQGTGVSISFDSGFLAAVTSLEVTINREIIDITTLATTGIMASEPSELMDIQISCELLFDASDTPKPMVTGAMAAEQIVITWTDSGTTTWTFNGFMNQFTVTSSEARDRNRASANIVATSVPVVA